MIRHWAGEHPLMVVFLSILAVNLIRALFPDPNSPQSSASNQATGVFTGPYSEYSGLSFDKVSPLEAPPKTKPVAKTPTGIAVVTGRYGATLYKRCAFLPFEDYSRCSFGHERVAQLKQGDRVRFLSPLTEAQSGADIYKVRTQQGWVGWARAEDLTLERQ